MTQRKTLLLIAALFMAATLILSGCGEPTSVSASNADTDALEQENQELKDRVAELEEQIENIPEAETQIAADTSIHALGVNCLLYPTDEGVDSASNDISFQDSVSLSAMLDAPESKAFDYWLVNGQRIDTTELIIDATTTTVVEAVVRDELTVTSVNADIQLMEGGNPQGDKVQEYNFEQEQIISIYVSAIIPSGYEIDHWIIDGYPHYFSRAITYFKIFDLDRTSTYEAVIRKIPEMVNVTCINATFSGGGYSNATSGKVEKGTKITVKGKNDIGSPQYWLINGNDDFGKGKSFTYTANSNKTFEYTGVN